MLYRVLISVGIFIALALGVKYVAESVGSSIDRVIPDFLRPDRRDRDDNDRRKLPIPRPFREDGSESEVVE